MRRSFVRLQSYAPQASVRSSVIVAYGGDDIPHFRYERRADDADETGGSALAELGKGSMSASPDRRTSSKGKLAGRLGVFELTMSVLATSAPLSTMATFVPVA